MKKLLSVLSTVSLLAVSGGSVVACGGNKFDQKDNDGNSILINGLGGFDINGGDINIGDSITTQDILDQVISNNGDSTLRGKIISRFINLLSAQFLQKGVTDETSTDITNNPYLNSGLKKALNNAYSELKSSVEADVKTERSDYDDQYGKKAATKWSDMLKAKFPGINDLGELETKYKEYKMLNDEDDNVNTRLLNTLLNTNQLGVKWIDTSTLTDYLRSWDESNDKDAWVKSNIVKAQQLVWSTLDAKDYSKNMITDDEDGGVAAFNKIFNASTKLTSSNSNNNVVFEEGDDVTKTDINTLGLTAPTAGTKLDAFKTDLQSKISTAVEGVVAETDYTVEASIDNSDGQTFTANDTITVEAVEASTPLSGSVTLKVSAKNDIYSLIKYSSPENLDNLQTGNNYATNGYLSNSQRFFLDKFYENESPVAISQVTIAYATGGSMDNGIDYTEDFASKNPTNDDEKRIENVNKFLNSDKLNSNFDSILSGGSFTDITNKAVSNLMTLSDSTNFSQMQRNVVYDFINGGTGATAKGSISDIVGAVTRGSNSAMYTVLDDKKGILAYVDSDGLQVVRIEGYDLLKTANSKANSGTIGESTSEDGKTSVEDGTASELGAFRQFDKMTDEEKLSAIQDKDKTGMYDLLNSKISNPYLHFLVNQSLIKGVGGAHTSFDIMESVKSYVKISQPSSGGQFTYWTGLMDYFFEIQNAGRETKQNFEEFFGNCVTTGDSDAAKTLVTYVKSWIESVQIQETNDNITQFVAAQETEKKTITDNSNEKYPKGVFDAFDSDAISKLMKFWEVYGNTASDPGPDSVTYFTFDNVSFDSLKGGWL